ncbi:UNVERIFIED_CONTAM: hypothetical protein PYX00_000797 [Menopon gallinae]|uniref:Farnesoic acid O-methyl transferase domain-containing protein n=1 Tax=Menopon gallinae TaxID=328185 RepID=A0AAW2IBQ8_9NEOP
MEIQTPDELKYQFQPAPNGVFNFAVRAPNDAHIALTKGPEESDPMYEVFLGGWSNSKSVIRKNRTKPDVAEVETPDILSAGEFRRFWIKWQNGSISAGRGDDPEPFLAFTDNEIVPIGYVGVCTGWGATGTWKIEGLEQEINTRDCGEFMNYMFYPSLNGFLEFEVKAPSNAHVALAKGATDQDQMYEIVLGGWNNTASAIQYRARGHSEIRVQESTPGLLNAGEFRHFSIEWQNAEIRVVHKGRVLLSWTIPDVHKDAFGIAYYGVHTGHGAAGTWRIHKIPLGFNMLSLSASESSATSRGVPPQPSAPSAPSGGNFWWQKTSNGQVLDNAVQGGVDLGSGEVLYIARAEHEGALLPGKCVPSHGVTYVPWGGGEHGKPEYEILCGCQGEWVAASEGHIPEGALEAGKTEDGEVLYIGRVNDGERFGLGKVQASHKVCYIPYGGQELAYPDYEVYVLP